MYFLFDFDGTIADTLNLVRMVPPELEVKYHLPKLADADITALRMLPAQQVFGKLGISPLQLPFFLADIRKLTSEKITTIEMFPGLREVLTQLKTAGHHLSIVTSNSAENVELFLTKHQARDLFDFVHSELNLWGKAAALKNVLKAKKIPPAEAYYIGDELRDIAAAHGAGLRIISVGWGFNAAEALQEARPDFMAAAPEDLLQYI